MDHLEKGGADGSAAADWAPIHEELRGHKHVTLQLLWHEYKQTHPDGYQHSRFCELYAGWKKKLDVVLRQEYPGGEKLFVDHTGTTLPMTDPRIGQVRPDYLFVATLGASCHTCAEATEGRDLASWIVAALRKQTFDQLYSLKLLRQLAVAWADGSFDRLLARLARTDLLAIDDFGLVPLADLERRHSTPRRATLRSPARRTWLTID